MSLYIPYLLFIATLFAFAYGKEIFTLLNWYVQAPSLQGAETLAKGHQSQHNHLLGKLLSSLRYGDEQEREKAERLLLNYPSSLVTKALVPMLQDGPWSDSGSAAARVLLSQGDESVIEPLNSFFSLQEGGIASFLGEVEKTSQEFTQTGKVISLFGRRRGH